MQQNRAVAAIKEHGTLPPTVITRTVVLTPTKDNTLYENNDGATSNGIGAFFFVGKTAGGSIRRGLMAFDMAGSLPPGATVVSASVQLQMSKTSGGAATVGLHRALADWGEGTSDASGNEGQGAAATTGDATWLHTFYDTALWQTPGGDFVPTATVSTTVDGIGSYTWASTPTLVAEVQGWLTTPANNFGWVVVGDESANGTAKRFTARESGAAANRPQLTVVYTVTETALSNIYLPIIQK
ncbi:MAG TPA: DNRLRE domain-containing protein [Caldilineaceae bacterium]|nr:DNRLRE domain-containing protein [Caldilineaceae bacterium]HRW07525.1 DNRLRE domain-containing protein [Caldilineaceae bacterium]